MSENALPKGYEPHAVEDHWREYWEKNKTFTPDPDGPGEPFSIVIPPPNVTGALHIGHALNHTLIDVLCRHARQKGKNVVERALAKEGKSRHDLGREAFVERVWQWKEDYGNRILNQIRMLGDSVDWTRERFTMDEGLSKAVRKVFVELYKEGYIYKGKYIINWCSRCHTALADDEVDHMPEKGHLYHVRYDFEDGSGSVIIATTRPETIMADTGVCVHPEDERYAGLVGKKIIVPVIGRAVPLFADRYVDKEFGTGALKVTPCHDPNDWTLGERHGLEFIQCIDEDGNMTAEAGPYAGLSKEECRKRIVEDLQASGQLVKIENLDHSVGHYYRCKTVVEPHMSEQWFVASTKLAPRARAAVELDKVQGLHHQWLLHRLEEVKKDVDDAIEAYRFNDAAQTLYKFLWNEFCDWYLELIRPDMKEEGPRKAEAQYVLWTALREFLILMHPIMPFVTAEIWQALPGGAGSDAAVQLLPEARPGCLKPEAAARMEFVQEVIGMIRTIRAELNIAPSYRLTVLLRPSDAHQKDVLEANREVILTLARLGELIIDADGEAPKASASHVAQGCEVIVHLSGAVDFAAELARLEKELGKIDKELGGLNQKLANEGFVSRAPAEIVERERARVAELTDARVKLTALQQRFRDVM